jgi:hypothetical protein
MKRILWMLGLAAGVAILLILMNFINRQRMGDLLDLAYDPTNDRLYVAAGERGLYTFRAENGQLDRISRFSDSGNYRNIEIQGGRAYIADSERGLLILDITEDRPRFVFAGENLHGRGIHLAGGLLYLAAGEDGLIIYSLAEPDAPLAIGRYRDLENAWDVTVDGYLAYVADEPRGLEILDVSSPAQPLRLGFSSWDPVYAQAELVRSEAGFVYVAAGQYGLRIIDARIPASPTIAAEYNPGDGSLVKGLAVRNWLVYLSVNDERDGSLNGLHVLDVHNPYSPQFLGSSTYAERSEGVIVQGDTVFVANPSAGVRAYNVSDPTDPNLADRFRYFP